MFGRDGTTAEQYPEEIRLKIARLCYRQFPHAKAVTDVLLPPGVGGDLLQLEGGFYETLAAVSGHWVGSVG